MFRGQFLQYCIDLIGEDLVNEAWETKPGDEALDYGNRIMAITDKSEKERNLEYLEAQRLPPDTNENTIESKLHILYSLAKWLMFYGKNGHGYKADSKKNCLYPILQKRGLKLSFRLTEVIERL